MLFILQKYREIFEAFLKTQKFDLNNLEPHEDQIIYYSSFKNLSISQSEEACTFSCFNESIYKKHCDSEKKST